MKKLNYLHTQPRSKRQIRHQIRHNKQRQKLSRNRLAFELLEQRTLLATIAWDGGAAGTGTNWNDPENWVGDVLPGASDDAEIAAAFAGFGITHASGSTTVRSVSSAASLSITGGTFTTNDTSMISGVLSLSGGTLLGSGELVAGALTWNRGTMGGSGTTIVNGATTIDLNQNVDVLLRDSRRLVLNGNATANGSALDVNMDDMSVLEVAESATLTLNDGIDIVRQSGGTPSLVNNGTLVKAGAGQSTISTAFNNSGPVNVEDGTLSVAGGGMSSLPGTSYVRSAPDTLLNLSTDLLGDTSNSTAFGVLGGVKFIGGGTRQLEVMGRDVGNLASGFDRNFAYGTMEQDCHDRTDERECNSIPFGKFL